MEKHSSEPNIRKEWISFNDDPDRVSKNLVLCSLHFTMDSFTDKAQFDTGFSERLKLKDNAVIAVLTILSRCFYCVVTALSVIFRYVLRLSIYVFLT